MTHRHLCHYTENQWKALNVIVNQTGESMATVIRTLIRQGLYHTAFCDDHVHDTIAEEALMLWLNLGEQEPQSHSADNNNGYVYIARIKESNTFKIGCTIRTPEQRVKEIDRSISGKLILFAVIPTKLKSPDILEKKLHALFRPHQIIEKYPRGREWFRMKPEYILETLSQHGIVWEEPQYYGKIWANERN